MKRSSRAWAFCGAVVLAGLAGLAFLPANPPPPGGGAAAPPLAGPTDALEAAAMPASPAVRATVPAPAPVRRARPAWAKSALKGAPAATRPATDAEIVSAIGRGRQYLLGRQKGGNWEDFPAPRAGAGDDDLDGGQWGGRTALATNALLVAGEPTTTPEVAAGITFLARTQAHGTAVSG